LKIAYGYDINDGSDELINILEEAMDQFSKLFKTSGYLVDYISYRTSFV